MPQSFELLLGFTLVCATLSGGCDASVSLGSGGASTTSSGDVIAQTCKQPFESFAWTYDGPDGSFDSSVTGPAQAGKTSTLDLEGTVVASARGELSVDSCPPNADCVGSIRHWVFSTAAPADLTIPVGTHVRVRQSIKTSGYYQPLFLLLDLQIDNLPTFGGVVNPTEPGTRMWTSLLEGAGLFDASATQTTARCTDDNPFWTRWAEEVSIGGAAVTVEEGETKTLVVSSGPHVGSFHVSDVQSHADQIEGAFPPIVLVSR